ncbi:MAG: glycosyltransferase family 9 protein [Methylacidiphilales bacterium]|nr:glycosyltransferase family 9 protein [Candidatus Methylacidiphilales bacterium]
MNFPGLDPAWILTHRSLQHAGVIRPWNLGACRNEINRGAKVLVVSSTALGDTVLCTPLLRALSENLGRDHTGFLVKKPYRDLYAADAAIGEVFTVSGKYRGWLEMRRKILDGGYQIALIANTTEPDLIPWLWHCGIRGFLRYRSRWSQWSGWFANINMMRKPGEPDYATGHAIDNNLAMAEALGLAANERRTRLSLPDTISDSRQPIIMIHPGASRPRKRWPLERWIYVGRMLLDERPEARVLVTGSKEEAADAARLAEALGPRATNLAGNLGLMKLLELQSQAALFLSGDTGPYHMAVAVDCPTVTLFAPTDRGSSAEACGPKYSDPSRHAVLEISSFEAGISSIRAESVLAEAHRMLRG